MTGSPATPSWSWAQVRRRRLERHGLGTAWSAAAPADVARAICGAHAQIMSAAELSIATRLADATRASVQQALADRSLVKTYGPRGTVHLLPTADLAGWTGALSALPPPRPAPPEMRMTDEQTDRVVAAIAEALADVELTIEELHEEVVGRAGPWAGDLVMPAFQTKWPRWRQSITLAAHRGALVFGTPRQRQVTFTGPGRWCPGFRPRAGPESLAWLVRAYLHAYGPATPRDFAQWLATSRRWAAQLFDELGAALAPVEVEGRPAWVAAGDEDPPSGRPAGLRLLPYFDSYVVGGQPRERVYPGAAATRALSPSGQAGNFPVLLVEGEVAGVWHARRSGRAVAVTVEPLAPLSAARRRQLDRQVSRVGEILEAIPELTVGPVTVGGHA